MVAAVRRGMDVLYWFCVGVGGTALVLIAAVIPWAVFTRYVLNEAASWPEPFAVRPRGVRSGRAAGAAAAGPTN